jgi:hypothetical protein
LVEQVDRQKAFIHQRIGPKAIIREGKRTFTDGHLQLLIKEKER